MLLVKHTNQGRLPLARAMLRWLWTCWPRRWQEALSESPFVGAYLPSRWYVTSIYRPIYIYTRYVVVTTWIILGQHGKFRSGPPQNNQTTNNVDISLTFLKRLVGSTTYLKKHPQIGVKTTKYLKPLVYWGQSAYTVNVPLNKRTGRPPRKKTTGTLVGFSGYMDPPKLWNIPRVWKRLVSWRLLNRKNIKSQL